LEDEAQGIRENEIKKLLENELGGKLAVIWPSQSRNITDKEPVFRIAYLPFEFVYETKKEQEKVGIEYLMQQVINREYIKMEWHWLFLTKIRSNPCVKRFNI